MSTAAAPAGRHRLGRGVVRSTGAAAVLAVVVGLLDAVWMLIDTSSPSYDQSSYLTLAIAYNHALATGGPLGLVDAMQAMDPSRGPLYVVATMPFLALFGDSPRSALLLNVVLAPVLLLSAGEIARMVFGNHRARLLAIVLVGTTPLVVGLYHNVLVDFQLITLTCLAVLLLLRSDLFRRRWTTVGMGVVMALGTLTKVTFPVFVLGPALVAVVQLVLLARRSWRVSRAEDGGDGAEPAAAGVGGRLVNLAVALGGYVVLVAVWYVPNRQATLDYIRSTTGGPLAAGAGPDDPLTLHNIYAFVLGTVNGALTWLLVLTGLAALLLGLPGLLRAVRGPAAAAVIGGAATMLSWFAIPFLVLVSGHNQDFRLMAPGVVAVPIAVAGGLSVVRRPALRVALAAVACTALALQTVNRVVPIGPAWAPDQATLTVRSQVWSQPVGASSTLLYERLPLVDRASPVMDWVEDAIAESPRPGPHTLCLLQSHPVINSNTFRYLAAARGDELQLVDVVVGPEGRKGLRAQLEACDVALFIKPPRPTSGPRTRVEIVNDPYAANYMGPRLFEVFHGPQQSFPVGDAPVSDRADPVDVPVDDTTVLALSLS